MYEKTSTLPPKGSLREALFLTVWLRRQEAEVYRTRILAQGIVDMSEQGAKATQDVFKQYVTSVLPFMQKQQSETDKKLKDVMEREVKKGVIVFEAPKDSPLMQRAKTMSLPDELRHKLANRKKRVVEV